MSDQSQNAENVWWEMQMLEQLALILASRYMGVLRILRQGSVWAYVGRDQRERQILEGRLSQ